MHRFNWDLRYPAVEGVRGGGGPFVLPGTYRVRFSAGGVSETKALEVELDPRLAADGVTIADLKEQLELQTKLGEAMAQGRRAAARLRETREKLQRGGGSPAAVRAIESLEARLVTAGGSYPQPMLVDQLANVARMIGQADQRVGRDAFLRYEDLRKELDALLAEADKAVGTAPQGSR
jgi:hypothetical protein